MTAVLSGSFSTEAHVQLRGLSYAVWPLLYACAQPYYPSSGLTALAVMDSCPSCLYVEGRIRVAKTLYFRG